MIENSNSQYLEMLKRSREQLKNGNVVAKSMDELERMEDEYDAKIADEAYDEYIQSDKKSRPLNELWQAWFGKAWYGMVGQCLVRQAGYGSVWQAR